MGGTRALDLNTPFTQPCPLQSLVRSGKGALMMSGMSWSQSLMLTESKIKVAESKTKDSFESN